MYTCAAALFGMLSLASFAANADDGSIYDQSGNPKQLTYDSKGNPKMLSIGVGDMYIPINAVVAR